MIFNMNGGGGNAGGGAGAGLNFKVVGGTSAPSNPAENTVWVNTDTTITSWELSPVQPTAVTGKVWVFTSEASNVKFNALKTNGIRVYLMSVKQYISGEWVAKTPKIYQDGSWKDWIVDIYNLGWVAASGFDYAGTDSSKYVTVSYDNGYMILQKSGWAGWAWAATKETFNLTGIDTIYCETGPWDENYGTALRFGVCTGDTSKREPNAQVKCTSPNTVYALDVSSLSGDYKIGFYCYNDDYSDCYWIPKTIKAFWY